MKQLNRQQIGLIRQKAMQGQEMQTANTAALSALN